MKETLWLTPFFLCLSLSPASSNLIENIYSLVSYGATVQQYWRLIYPKNGLVHYEMFNFVCVFASLSVWVPVCLIMSVCVCAGGWVGGWVDVCICELVEQAEPQPGSALGRILTQTVCSNETSARGGIVWEDPRVCECLKSVNSGRILTRLTWKEEHEEEKGRVDKILQTSGNWGNMRVKEKEINEREGRQLPVCVCLGQPLEWLRAAGYTLRFVPAH